MTEFFGDLPNLIGIFGLMLSSFLIGYFAAWWSQKTRFGQLTKKLQDQVSMLKSKLAAAQMQNHHEDLLPEEPEMPKIAPQRSNPAPAPISRKVYTAPQETKPKPEVVAATPPAPSQDYKTQQTPVEKPSIAAPPETVAQKARSSYISYTKNKPELNFDSFGYADAGDKDDLTRINGIGPYIEQRLNEIGVFNYDQISKLKQSDIRVITELIDFFPERIERDNWVGQARSLMVY